MDKRMEEIVRYGRRVLVATCLLLSVLPEKVRARQLKALEQVGRRRYAKLMGLVTVLFKEEGLSEEEALKEAIYQVGEIIFGEDAED